MKAKPKHIFFVDDEASVRKAVRRTLQRPGWKVTCFSGAVNCLAALRRSDCDLLITDVNMPGMDGIELLKQAKRLRPTLPVLIVTGYGNIPLAVRAVKAGALEFMEKPLDRQTLLAAVEAALRSHVNPDCTRLLTKTERQILELIVAGKHNRRIAELLGRSVRTIEDHRNHIMHKLNVDNVIDLVKKATGANQQPPSSN